MVKDWDTTTIGEFLDFKNGLNKGKDFFGVGTPIVNYMDVYKKRGLHANDIKGSVTLSRDEIKRFEVKKGDVFFTRTSETPEEVGYPSVMLDDITDCVFSGFVLRGRPKNNLFDIEYCQYAFFTPEIRKAIMMNCTYTTRALTNGRQLSAIELPLPKKSEQRAIAAALSDTDTYIDKLEKLIAKKRAIKQGSMQELLTGKRRLPRFKGEWVVKKLCELADIVSGGTPKTSVNEYWDGNIIWVVPTDITGQRQKYLSSSERKITKLGLSQSGATLLPAGTILLCSRATIGDLAIAAQPTATNQGFKNLVCFPETDNEFLYYAIQPLKSKMIERASGSTFLEISKTALGTIKVFLPPTKREQTAIATVLSEMDAEIDTLTDKLNKAKHIKQGIMSELLTGRIRLIQEGTDDG